MGDDKICSANFCGTKRHSPDIVKKDAFIDSRDGEYMSDFLERKSLQKIGAANGKKESTCHRTMPQVATKSIEWGDGKSVGLLYRFGKFGQRVAFGGENKKRIQCHQIGHQAQRLSNNF